MRARLSAVNGRREAIYVALAAAELCWAAPLFLALNQTTNPHPPVLLWLGMLVLLLGYFYFYRALEGAYLSLGAQQGLMVAALLLGMVLLVRFHVYGSAGFEGTGWLIEMFRSLTDVMAVMPPAWVAMITLVYLWARSINLARRSLSSESVGFSFRGGVVVLIGVAFMINLYSEADISGFVVPYFFFSLIAVALARIESVSRVRGSTSAQASGFWVGSTVGAVALLTLLGMVVAVFFYGGGLRQVLRWLSPLFLIVEIMIAVVGVLFLMLVESILSLFSLDLSFLGEALLEAMETLRQALMAPRLFLPPDDDGSRMALFGAIQAGTMIAIPLIVIVLVILASWYRSRRLRREDGTESRESLLTPGAVGRNLLAALQAGRDRLAELVGLVDRFGLGTRLLSAISIRRIYANLVRLATKAGYPRLQAQTPNEYLVTLYEAFPGSDADVDSITEAYVNAHYGQVPDSREDLQQIRECWQRVREQYAKMQE